MLLITIKNSDFKLYVYKLMHRNVSSRLDNTQEQLNGKNLTIFMDKRFCILMLYMFVLFI